MTIKVAGLKLFGLKSNIHNKINQILSQLNSILCIIQFSIVSIFYKYVNQLFLFFLTSLFFFDRNDNSTIMALSNHGNNRSGSKTQNRSFHTSCRAVNRIGPHNEDVIAVLIGLLLGYGYAVNRSGEGVLTDSIFNFCGNLIKVEVNKFYPHKYFSTILLFLTLSNYITN